MEEDARAPQRTSLRVLTAAAWLTAIVPGVALPAVLVFFALVTGAPIESSTPNPGVIDGTLLLLARLGSTIATACIVVLIVLARRHGSSAVLVWVPGIISAAAALLLWDIR